jgi:hypothetical protein
MVPASDLSTLSSVQSNSQTVFLEPVSQNGDPAQSSFNNGQVIPVSCGSGGGEYGCTETLNVTPASGYYLHIVPIYDEADFSIKVNGGSVGLANAQALIDSTGKASDELKRIQEYVSINPVGSNDAPTNALQSQSGICKQFTTRPGSTSGNTESC